MNTRISYFFAMILAVVVDWAVGSCDCGDGGLCRVYNDENPSLAASAEPCQCDLVSRGIFVSRTKACNTPVRYCPGHCALGEVCLEGYGTHLCYCYYVFSELLYCPTTGMSGTSRLVRIWYYSARKTTWDLIVSGAILSKKIQIRIEFDYGRIMDFSLNECVEVSYETLAEEYEFQAPKAWAIFNNISDVAKKNYYSDFHHLCRIPLVFEQDRNVFIHGLAGPVGQYHDVKVTIYDEVGPVFSNKAYRVFVKSVDIVKNCGFQLNFKGCGTSPSDADQYILGNEIALTVSAFFGVNRPDQCFMKSLSYEWFVSTLHHRKQVLRVGSGRSVILDLSSLGLEDLLYVFHVEVNIQSAFQSGSEMIMGQCFLRFFKKKLSAFILHGNRFIMCEVITKVVLQCYVRSGFSGKALTYKWNCPADLCGNAKLTRPTLEFYANLSCDQERLIDVTVTNNLTSDSHTSTSTLTFVRQPYNIFLTCTPDCDNANPALPLTLQASEDPIYDSCFQWVAEEITFDSACIPDCSSIVVIQPSTLSRDAIYNVTVSTRYGSQMVIIQTAAGPSTPVCEIHPIHGVAYLTKFNISCNSWSEFMPLEYWIHEGPNHELVSISSRKQMNNIRFGESLVSVDARDSLGLISSENINISLKQPNSEEVEQLVDYFMATLDRLQMYLHDEDYTDLVDQIDVLTKLDIVLELNPFHLKQRLVDYLARVKMCQWIECIIKAANSIYRLTNNQVKNETSGVDDYVLKCSEILYTLTFSLDQIPSKVTNDIVTVLSSIHDAVRQSMKFMDPTLFYPNVDEDDRQVHFRRVQEANKYARRTISKLGLFITTYIPHPSPAFQLVTSGAANTIVLSNRMEFINCFLPLNRSNSHFQFILNGSRTFTMPGTQWSVAVAYFTKEDFWWLPKNTDGEMFEVHLYRKDKKTQNWTLVEGQSLGDIKTYTKFNCDVMPTGTISGQFISLNDEKSHPTNVHHIIVPRGHGTLALTLSTDLINITINYFRRPSFDWANTVRLNNSLIFFTYYLGLGSQDVYIEVTSINGSINYSVNYTLIKCVRRSEDLWKSESCRYLYRFGNRLEVCMCNYMSLFNVEASTPSSSLVLPTDIKLHTRMPHELYTLVMFGGITFCVLCLFIFAFYYDSKNDKKAAMFLDDNYPGENYPYLIGLYTGGRCFAGTSSHIALRLIGDVSISRVHLLTAMESKPNFVRANDRWFILNTAKKLGRIGAIEIWHDSSGRQPNWYCAKVIVWDVESSDKFEFFIESWITAAKLYSQGDTSYIFLENKYLHFKKGKPMTKKVFKHLEAFLRQEHHWASIFILHHRSLYSRLERALVLTVVILVTVVTSMIFFFATNPGPTDEPTITFTTEDFQVSLVAMAVSLVVSTAVSQIFSLEKERIMRQMTSGLGSRRDSGLNRNHYFHPMPYYRPIVTTQIFKTMKRNHHLPWGAYTICGVIIIFSFIVITSMCLKINKNKSFIWFITFVVALAGEALLLNPAQIVITSILASRSFRLSPLDLIVIDLEPLEEYSPYKDVQRRLDAALHYRVKPNYKPPLRSVLEDKAAKDPRDPPNWWLHAAFVTLIFSFIIIIIHNMHIQLDFYKNKQIIWQLSQSKSSTPVNLKSVLNRTRYFNYLRATLMPALHRMAWYNGKPLHTELNEPENPFDIPRPSLRFRGFCDDFSTKLVGLPRLRQQRISPEWRILVASEFRGNFSQAYGYLSMLNKDSKLYLPHWNTPRLGEVYYKTYRHWTAKETKAGWQSGPSLLLFSGDGYVTNLHWSLGVSLSSLVDLELDGWLDNLTRAIFLSFSLYNIYVDEISSVTIITEVLPAGVYRSQAKVLSTSASPQRLPNERIILASVVSIAVVLVVHVKQSVLFMSKYGFKIYVSWISGSLDVIMIAFGLFFVIYSFFRYAMILDTYETVEAAAKDDYISLDSLFFQNDISLISISLFCFTAAAFSAFLFHRLFGFEKIQVAAVSIRWAIVVVLVTIVVFGFQSAFLFYNLASGEVITRFFYSMFFKDAIIVQNVEPAANYPAYFSLPVIGFVILTRLNIAIVLPYYIKTAETEYEAKTIELRNTGSRLALIFYFPQRLSRSKQVPEAKSPPFIEVIPNDSNMSLKSL